MSELQKIIKKGREETFDFFKLKKRLDSLASDLDHNFINTDYITTIVKNGLPQSQTLDELIDFVAEVCVTNTTKHPDYNLLAGRVAICKLHKKTKSRFSEVIEELYDNYVSSLHQPLVSKTIYDVAISNRDVLDKVIDSNLDFTYTFFAFRTIEKSYLLKKAGKIVERPQHLFMRVALAIHSKDINKAIQSYRLLANKFFIHASPTLFNAGTPNANLCSCYIHPVREDSVKGIYDSIKRCALISRGASGLGLAIHDVRAEGSYINGNHGYSNGLIPFLRVLNATAKHITQGGNKRPAAFSVYLEPWHSDVFDFLNLKKNSGKEEYRARDMFYGLWVPDLMMRRVERDEDWTLMSPHLCPGLSDVWGEEFDKLYIKYEKENKGSQTIKARHLWKEICISQVETGMPYILFKDSCNKKSNQQHLGTTKGSNPCAELVQFFSPSEVSTCNVASISVNKFVVNQNLYDFKGLGEVTEVLVENLDNIIDINNYPFYEAQLGGQRHRNMAVGVQGLADAFHLMKMSYGGKKSKILNKRIFETIYYHALKKSCELAKQNGTYESYEGSPASRGLLQMDFWQEEDKEEKEYLFENKNEDHFENCEEFGFISLDWKGLRTKINKFGLRNSHLVGLMPTSSTSQIFGNCECFEPYTSNLFSRRVYSGEYQVINPHLVKELINLKLWNEEMRMKLMEENGSIQNIEEIPNNIKKRFKTVWELSQKIIIDLARDRHPFVDQSQSMNLFLRSPSYEKLCSMHFYAWKKGLKTGSYYLRTRPAADPIKTTVEKNKLLIKRKILNEINYKTKIIKYE